MKCVWGGCACGFVCTLCVLWVVYHVVVLYIDIADVMWLCVLCGKGLAPVCLGMVAMWVCCGCNMRAHAMYFICIVCATHVTYLLSVPCAWVICAVCYFVFVHHVYCMGMSGRWGSVGQAVSLWGCVLCVWVALSVAQASVGSRTGCWEEHCSHFRIRPSLLQMRWSSRYHIDIYFPLKLNSNI